jgi:hypothetical protein
MHTSGQFFEFCVTRAAQKAQQEALWPTTLTRVLFELTEACLRLKEAIEGYLKTLQKDGLPISTGRTPLTDVRGSVDLVRYRATTARERFSIGL